MELSCLFFELVQVALGTRNTLSRAPSDAEWNQLYGLCINQAISGVVFPALNVLNETGIKPPISLLYEWIGQSEQIKQHNKIINQNTTKVYESLEKEGFDCCILKGQGNNLLYPDSFTRSPGDIDVWLMEQDNRMRINVKNIISFVRKRGLEGHAMYHHVAFGEFNGTEVEIHYRPSFMFNLVNNKRLQRWFLKNAEEQFRNKVELPEGVGAISVPTTEFNMVFQLAHVYNHLLHEGIGLRQIIDYFYVLKSNTIATPHSHCDATLSRRERENRTDNTNVYDTLRYLGLEKIAGAMMWVLHEKLGLPEEYLIAPIDERRGKILLSEIMRGGNFGYYDSENVKATSRLKKNVLRIKRDLHMMRYFPSECLWEPVFRVYHLFWRMRYN